MFVYFMPFPMYSFNWYLNVLKTFYREYFEEMKWLWNSYSKKQQDIDEFINEVLVIAGVKHKNLVKLKGCCITISSKRLLVYEHVQNNDLAQIFTFKLAFESFKECGGASTILSWCMAYGHIAYHTRLFPRLYFKP